MCTCKAAAIVAQPLGSLHSSPLPTLLPPCPCPASFPWPHKHITHPKGLFALAPRQFAQDFVMSTDVRSSGAVADLQEDEDGVYFSSYGHYGIHEEMLKVRKASPLHSSRTGEERWNAVGSVPISVLQSSCIFNPCCPLVPVGITDHLSVLFPLYKFCLWEAPGT